MNSLQALLLNEREFQTAGALTLTVKALADNANDLRGTVIDTCRRIC